MIKMSIYLTIAVILGMVACESEPEPIPVPETETILEFTPRVLAHITTDKPVYKPNDMAFIEAYIFDPTTHGPATLLQNRWNYELSKMTWQPTSSYATVIIKDSNDDEIYSDR
jgi:uncharacterized protein YcfL